MKMKLIHFFTAIRSHSFIGFIVALFFRIFFLILGDLWRFFKKIFTKNGLLVLAEEFFLFSIASYLVILYYLIKGLFYFFVYLVRIWWVIITSIVEYVAFCCSPWSKDSKIVNFLKKFLDERQKDSWDTFIDDVFANFEILFSYSKSGWNNFNIWSIEVKYRFNRSSFQFFCLWLYYFYFIVFLDFFIYPFIIKFLLFLVTLFFDYFLSPLVDVLNASIKYIIWFFYGLYDFMTLWNWKIPYYERNHIDMKMRRKIYMGVCLLIKQFFLTLKFFFFYHYSSLKIYLIQRWCLFVVNVLFFFYEKPKIVSLVCISLIDVKVYYRIIILIVITILKLISYFFLTIRYLLCRFLNLPFIGPFFKRPLIYVRLFLISWFESIQPEWLYNLLYFIILHISILFYALWLLVLKAATLNYLVHIVYVDHYLIDCKNMIVYLFYKCVDSIKFNIYILKKLYQDKNVRDLAILDIKTTIIHYEFYLEEKIIFLKYYWKRFLFMKEYFFKYYLKSPPPQEKFSLKTGGKIKIKW